MLPLFVMVIPKRASPTFLRARREFCDLARFFATKHQKFATKVTSLPLTRPRMTYIPNIQLISRIIEVLSKDKLISLPSPLKN